MSVNSDGELDFLSSQVLQGTEDFLGWWTSGKRTSAYSDEWLWEEGDTGKDHLVIFISVHRVGRAIEWENLIL